MIEKYAAVVFSLAVAAGWAVFPSAAAQEQGKQEAGAAPVLMAEEEVADFSGAPVVAIVPPPVGPVVVSERVLTLDLTTDANDIWDRIRRGFRVSDLSNERVTEQQLFYLGHPGFLKQVLSRGGRYLYYIVDEIERRGLPTELALLPLVESNYNPLAYSRAHASGLWQFIPSTGRHYNLTQNHWVDERRDVIASTNAALDYLQNLYELHGDWHLALASYNWGEGAVSNALMKNRAAGLPSEYDALTMPAETRNYIPKLQAIKNIIAAPERFELELPYVANEQWLTAIPAPAGIDLALAAQYAEMALPEFLALNPGYNRPAIATPGQSLIVPADRADRFAARLDEFIASGKGWRSHTLAKGEKLDELAKRHGLTPEQIRQINALPKGSQVSAGHALLVPDGIDPRGALAVSRLLPDTASASSPGKRAAKVSGKLAKAKKTGKKAARASYAKAGKTSKTSRTGKKAVAKAGAKAKPATAKASRPALAVAKATLAKAVLPQKKR
jgi:membrane-bound lytic murein transglycosylase D